MRVGGVAYRTIWVAEDGRSVEIIDQTRLPHAFVTQSLRSLDDAARAIRSMQVRGAPLIGVTAAYGVCLALRDDPSDAALEAACAALLATRPTAVNLRWVVEQLLIYVVEEGILMGCVAEHGTLVTRQFVAQGTQEPVVGKDAAVCIQVFAFVFHTPVSMHEMMRKLERDGLIWPPALAEWQCNHSRFKVDEVQRESPLAHFIAQAFPIHPDLAITGRCFSDLQPPTLTCTEARLVI